MLNRIQVRTVRWQPQYGMLVFLKHLHNRPLMESCIVHDHHTVLRQVWDQYLLCPFVKHLPVDAAIEQTDGKQPAFMQSTYGIGLVSSLPVITGITPLPPRGAAIRTVWAFSKSAFIQVNNRPVFTDKAVQQFQESSSAGRVGLRVAVGLFL